MATNHGRDRTGRTCGALAPAAMAVLLASGAAAQQPSVGLSSVRAQAIANQTVGSFPAQGNDHFGWSFASGDFNGDGREELATGIPDDDGLAGGDVVDGGALIVSRTFPPSGLDPVRLVRQSAGLDAPEVGDHFAEALASCDFDDDGFDDVAVGIPDENIGSVSNAGAVQIHYGRAAGLPGFGSEFFSQNTPGIPGDAESGDVFGLSLACGDFDGDGHDDLVVGSLEQLGSADGAGMIVILPGWSGGLAADVAYSIDQDTTGIDGSPEDADEFGFSLAAGNFDGDAYVDLAVGAIGEDDVGAVQILFGSATGLDGARDLFWYDEAVGGTREEVDHFGKVLTTGDFDGDGFDDLAIGVPFEEAGTTGGTVNSGEVKIAYGAPGGFDLTRSQRFTQSTIPLANETSQVDDHFGAAIAAGDFNRDGFDDLAIGAPGEGISTANGQDGHVTVVMGTSSGLSASVARAIVAGRAGVPGSFTHHDKNFGWALGAGDFDGDGHDDLAIGAPFENSGGLGDAGTQTILYGSLFADGFETGDPAFWGP